MKSKTITRRKLLKDSTLAAIGASLFFTSPMKIYGRSRQGNLSRVVLIRDKNVLDENGNVNKALLEKMIDEGLKKLTGMNFREDAWAQIFKPNDVLGIKTNVWTHLPTPRELENLLKEKAIGMGVIPEKISINDRGVKNDPVFQKSTALINVRPMRTHNWSGVGSLLKNYITFAEDLPAYHPDSCADLAKLYNLPVTKGKTRLNILVMFTPLFHGVGPHHYNKKYVWNYCGLIMGFDPVAVDSTGLRIIQAKRKEFFQEDLPLNPPAKHIMLADTRHKLGTADPGKIELVKLGWEEDLLI
ncbi:MAG: DUF362 domain-containing protein [Bacteroidales bacterium]|nr:DUF362 domain-containing protein [Bacteroidales bacterium]